MIYVSHRMDEIRRITDKVAIFKDGRYIDTVVTAETDEKDMIKMMVGRDLGDIYAKLDKNKEDRRRSPGGEGRILRLCKAGVLYLT